MQILKNRIKKDGKVIGDDILKVDNFLNHQVDVELMDQIGQEFFNRFKDTEITKVLTIEASGIPAAYVTAKCFGVPMIYAKKYPHSIKNEDAGNIYQSEVYSFTKGTSYSIRVNRNYLKSGDKVLIIDDFLANGKAAAGLVDIINQAGAKVAGIGIIIEKGFQNGRTSIEELGYKIESLAIIKSMGAEGILFLE